MEELEIKPITFVDARKSFLGRPHVELLTEYKVVMRSKQSDLIKEYRIAVQTDDNKGLRRLRKRIKGLKR
jgi:hypothetical protein